MFIDEALRQHLPSDISHLASLDMCAAPGGKSTLLRAALPQDSVLYSNEPIRNRASILLENVQKWGYEHHFVTNLYPKDYRKAKMHFDLILCDVPCSGEGMFRKDEATIKEWSPQNVEKCWQLQREIVSDAWQCLNEGGILIYSTCTFNTKENEENVRWMMEELGAEVLPIETKAEWHITGSLLEGFHEPVYRFIPGITRSEGLFACVLRKGSFKSVPPLGKTCSSMGKKLFLLVNLLLFAAVIQAAPVSKSEAQKKAQQQLVKILKNSLYIQHNIFCVVNIFCFGYNINTRGINKE